jgi:hypothetical protein
MTAARSHHERGAMFGTDGRSWWLEPELELLEPINCTRGDHNGDELDELQASRNRHPSSTRCDYPNCRRPAIAFGRYFRACSEHDVGPDVVEP